MNLTIDFPEVCVCSDYRDAIDRARTHYKCEEKLVKKCSLIEPPIFVQTDRYTVCFIPWHELPMWGFGKTYYIGDELYNSGVRVSR